MDDAAARIRTAILAQHGDPDLIAGATETDVDQARAEYDRWQANADEHARIQHAAQQPGNTPDEALEWLGEMAAQKRLRDDVAAFELLSTLTIPDEPDEPEEPAP